MSWSRKQSRPRQRKAYKPPLRFARWCSVAHGVIAWLIPLWPSRWLGTLDTSLPIRLSRRIILRAPRPSCGHISCAPCLCTPRVLKTLRPPIRNIERSSKQRGRELDSWNKLVGNAIGGSTLSTRQLPHSIGAQVQAPVELKSSHSLRTADTAETSNKKQRKEKKHRRRWLGKQNEVNARTPTYASKLDLVTPKTQCQYPKDWWPSPGDIWDGCSRFLASRQAGKGSILGGDFLVG